MNFQNIKTKFILHLKETAPVSEWDKLNSSTSDESIFLHQEEFKEFLKDNYNILDSSINTISVADILKMNIVDGKLVDKTKPEETDENNNNENNDETPTEDNTENGWLSGFINDLFGNETFKTNVDTDGNGEITETELSDFLNYIKDLDGNSENLSLNDLFTTLESMGNGSFDMTSGVAQAVESTPEISDTSTPQAVSSSGGSSYGGGSGSYGSYGSDNSSYDSVNNNVSSNDTQKSYDNMTESELNQELTTNKTDLETNKNILNAIDNGTYDDSELNQLKSSMDEAYEAYKSALTPEIQKELDTITNAISEAETNIALKETEIVNQNLAISTAQSNYTIAQSTYQSYESAVESLKSKKDSSLSDEEKANLDSKISEAESKRDAAKEDVETKKTALENEQTKLTQLNQELKDLKTGEGGLESLNQQKQALEEKIKTECPSAETLMSAYNDAKSQYDAKKAELKAQATSAVEASQKSINEINEAKQNLLDKNDIDENYKAGLSGELFDPDAKLNMKFIKGKNGGFDYMLIAPSDIDPNEELPAMVFLHGTGERGGGASAMQDNFCPGGFMKNWGLNNFRGYIICPVLESGGKWNCDKSEKRLRNTLTEFQRNHKVSKTALTGASLGGSGTVYLANKMGDVFTRAAALSAFSSGLNANNSKIPIRGYCGSEDNPRSISYMKKTFSSDSLTIIQGAKHCQVPSAAFSIDNNGDNCSDLIQWLFED